MNAPTARDELVSIIVDAIDRQPRSNQVKVGPSEIGRACARRLGYRMLGADQPNKGFPMWKAYIGTAVHAALEGVLVDYNRAHRDELDGADRFLVEQRVNVGEIGGRQIWGRLDAFDTLTNTVIDWKIPGPAGMKKYRVDMAPDYRAQAHLYGRGLVRQGRAVEHVMILALPRNGELHEAVPWTEPYDERIALDALRRANAIHAVVDARGYDGLTLLPTADDFCYRCPYYMRGMNDLARGCPGDPDSERQPAPSPLTFSKPPQQGGTP